MDQDQKLLVSAKNSKAEIKSPKLKKYPIHLLASLLKN